MSAPGGGAAKPPVAQRAQLETLQGAPVELIADCKDGRAAFLVRGRSELYFKEPNAFDQISAFALSLR
jgi:hypothetical protein